MTTPARAPIGTPLQNLTPSSTFLKQLLEEINGTNIPTALQRIVGFQGAPRSRANSNATRRSSSVWVGGSSVAQDARDKLRAADEARLLKTSARSLDAAPHPPRPILHLRTPCFEPRSASSEKGTTSPSPPDPCVSRTVSPGATAWRTRSDLSNATEFAHPESTDEGLHHSMLSNAAVEALAASGFAGISPPLIFCDIDSDVSLTTSPTEPPTSAASLTFTDATTVSDDHPRAPNESSSRNFDKRARSGSATPEVLSKKMRRMTLPIPPAAQFASEGTMTGSDDRCLVHGNSFTERCHVLPEHESPVFTSTLPELSSFRPQSVGPQGVRPRPTTPVRPATRKSSAVERDQTPETAETPIYARSMHLIDTDISIYKQDHGDDWRDHALCLYCFRRHGGFNKLRQHGYEVCGRNEALESHYWESNGVDGDW